MYIVIKKNSSFQKLEDCEVICEHKAITYAISEAAMLNDSKEDGIYCVTTDSELSKSKPTQDAT